MQRNRRPYLSPVAAAILLMIGCADGEDATDATTVTQTAATTATATTAATPTVAPADIINNPSAWVGRRVTVSGDVEEVWTPRAFNMDSGITVGELLVVSREPFPNLADHDPLVDDVATVTGTVRMLAVAEVEREIGWDLQPEIEVEFTGKPMLVIDNATFQRPAASAAADPERITDMVLIIDAPDRISLIGRKVHLQDVRVQRVVGDRMFMVGPDASRSLLAVLAPGLDQPPFEQIVDMTNYRIVALTGEVRRAPSGAEAKQMNLKPDDAAALQKAKVYLYVTGVEVLRR